MNLFLDGYLNNRIGQISKDLLEKNADYARAEAIRERLWEKVKPVLYENTNIEISSDVRKNILELFDNVELMETIENKELYRRGYMDCINVLKYLGIL